jgi:4-hydroxymandelate synthase
MHVHGIDHVEFYVEDADRAADAFCTAYGFRVQGRIGPATGRPDHRSVLVGQRGIQILFTTGLSAGHPATEYVRRHGDGLATIALATDDPDDTLAEAVTLGATVLPPAAVTEGGDPFGRVRLTAFGDVAHTFVTPGELSVQFDAAPREEDQDEPLDLLDLIDHIAVCVPAGQLATTIKFYEHVLGFDQIFEEYIEVGDQAMNSQVVQNQAGTVTLTVLEPDSSQLPGQIDEFARPTTAPACSTSRCAPTTSPPRCAPCPAGASTS